jgi:hypothetical protein
MLLGELNEVDAAQDIKSVYEFGRKAFAGQRRKLKSWECDVEVDEAEVRIKFRTGLYFQHIMDGMAKQQQPKDLWRTQGGRDETEKGDGLQNVGVEVLEVESHLAGEVSSSAEPFYSAAA